MSPLESATVLLALLLVLLAAGVWIAISLAAVAWFGLQFFTTTPPDVNLFQSFWGSSASWTLAALPLFVWMGEILYRTRLSEEMFEGLSPSLGLRAPAGPAAFSSAGLGASLPNDKRLINGRSAAARCCASAGAANGPPTCSTWLYNVPASATYALNASSQGFASPVFHQSWPPVDSIV